MGSQKHQFWGPKSVNQPSKTPRGQVGWNDGETVAGGFGRGRLVVVGFPFPWFTTFFFFLEGSDICRVLFEVSQKTSLHDPGNSLWPPTRG